MGVNKEINIIGALTLTIVDKISNYIFVNLKHSTIEAIYDVLPGNESNGR